MILTSLLSKKLVASIFTLIFWRTICDLMISVAFIAMPHFQRHLRRKYCGDDDTCGDDDDWILDHQDKCLPMSLWLEFFQIASESWLLCITYDLVVMISNPFTSLSYRQQLYFPCPLPHLPPSLPDLGSNITISFPGVSPSS